MIRSMTGFARREQQGDWGTLVCELRSVNHRFLEVALRLPEDLRSLDAELRQVLASGLRRGKVDANIYLKNSTAPAQLSELNHDMLQALNQRISEIRNALPAAAPFNALDILRWPGVLSEIERDVTPLLAAATGLLKETIEDLNTMRSREGNRLRDMIAQRCDMIAAQVQIVKARLPDVAVKQRERLQTRLASLNATVDAERLEQELVLFAHKMDVDEELDRLQSHLVEIRSSIDSSEPAGRRLDFLMQELNREANTLSSKSQDADTTRAAVELKVLIEQMREQVQNIE